MPQRLRISITNLDEIPEEECRHVPMNCLWTITSQDTSLTVTITCVKWTFNYEFCVRVTAPSVEAPNVLKQIDLDDHRPLLRSLTDALNLYEVFPESHLNAYQLEILEELIVFLALNICWTIMAQPQLAYPDLARNKFSGTDQDQDAEAFIRLMECKIDFALGTEPDPVDLEHVICLFGKKALFSSLLRGPAVQWYGSTFQDAMTWNEVRTLFITKFSDRRNKLRHRLEVEHCVRADGEENRNFLHRMKKTVDKGWPDHVVRIAASDQNAECTTQARQRIQRYIYYTRKRLRRRYFQRKAQKHLMERPKATWHDFCTQINQKDLLLEVSSTFLSYEA